MQQNSIAVDEKRFSHVEAVTNSMSNKKCRNSSITNVIPPKRIPLGTTVLRAKSTPDPAAPGEQDV